MTMILDDMKSRFDEQTPMVTKDTIKRVLAMIGHFEFAHKIGEFENDPDGEIVRNSFLGHIDAFRKCALWMLNSYVGETSAEEVVDCIWDAMKEVEKPMPRLTPTRTMAGRCAVRSRDHIATASSPHT